MGKDNKERTQEQLMQRNKLLVMPLFGLVFLGCLYWIFAPFDDNDKEAGRYEYNSDVPSAINGELIDKKKAYEDLEMIQNKNERMQTLQDFTLLIGNADSTKAETAFNLKIEPKGKTEQNTVEHSGIAYQNMTAELNSFYHPASKENPKEKELENKIKELTEKLNEKENDSPVDQQMEIMEQSYKIAAKYLTPQQSDEQKTIVTQAETKTPKVIPVSLISENVVSSLPQQISDSMFFAKMQKSRNLGFNTVGVQGCRQMKNTIRACILSDQTVISGQSVKLRLLDAIRIGDTAIPANTELTGETELQGERLRIKITAIQYQNNLFPVELTAYDKDGLKGIHTPGSIETNAAKEAIANMGGSLGQSITINRNASQQIVSDMMRGVLQAGSQYVGTKVRQVKVHLKANYEVLLSAK